MHPLVQEGGLDTVDANRALGFPDDCREYTSVHNILRDLGVKSIRLMVRVSHIPALFVALALAALRSSRMTGRHMNHALRSIHGDGA